MNHSVIWPSVAGCLPACILAKLNLNWFHAQISLYSESVQTDSKVSYSKSQHVMYYNSFTHFVVWANKFSGLCVIWVAVVFHRIHVLHSKHAVFYGFWCRQWGKAKIQALSAEVIRLLVDNLWNILLLKAQCPGTPALSHVDPHIQTSVCTHKVQLHGKKRSIPKGYLVGCISIFFTGWHKTHLNSKHNLSGISAHTHDTHMPHMNLIIHLTVVSTPKPRNYTPSCITSVYISLPWKEQTPLNPHPTLARSSPVSHEQA